MPERNLSPVWRRITEIVADHGEGACLYDSAGTALSRLHLWHRRHQHGHCHPKVVAAIQEQAAKLIHGQINIVYHRPVLDLIEAFLPVVPPGLDSFFFSNSGAERSKRQSS